MLKPAFPLEEKIRQQRGDDHQAERSPMTPRLMQQWNVLKIHSVERANHGGRQQEYRDERENLQNIVLIDGQHAERGFERKSYFVPEERGVIAHRQYVPREG